MKKISENTNIVSIDLNKQDRNDRYTEELYKSLSVKPVGWSEDKPLHNVGGRSNRGEREAALRAIRYFAIGKYKGEGNFHLYADTNEAMLTKSIGVVKAIQPEIRTAQAFNKRTVDLVVPGYGLINFEMPRALIGEEWIRAVTSRWLAMEITGIGEGKLSNTDTDNRYPPSTSWLHGVLDSLINGYAVTVMVTMEPDRENGLYRKAHDMAEEIFTMITSKDFSPEKQRELLKEESAAYAVNRSIANSGRVVAFKAEQSNTQIETTGVVAVVNGSEMDCIEIPQGTYHLTTAKGKKIGKPYTVRSLNDRLGLSIRPDAETNKVYLVG
jgi:hypothetical protein